MAKGIQRKFLKKSSPALGQTIQQLEKYFKGELKSFDIPLLERGTDFQKKVWQAIRKIPWGKTITYRQLALQIKIPGGARAVGNACAKNPLLIVTPCHRVLSQKAYGGFALGLKVKKQLLFLEQKAPQGWGNRPALPQS